MAARSETPNFVVWEWLNDYFRWNSYPPHLNDYIERHHTCAKRIYLKDVDPEYSLYSIDFCQRKQLREIGGNTVSSRDIRRQLYDQSDLFGKGVYWQWEADNKRKWHNFDLQVSEYLEENYNSEHTQIDLSDYPYSMPYKIDLGTMVQIRIGTGRSRPIRRFVKDSSSSQPPLKVTSNVNIETNVYDHGHQGVCVENKISAHDQHTQSTASLANVTLTSKLHIHQISTPTTEIKVSTDKASETAHSKKSDDKKRRDSKTNDTNKSNRKRKLNRNTSHNDNVCERSNLPMKNANKSADKKFNENTSLNENTCNLQSINAVNQPTFECNSSCFPVKTDSTKNVFQSQTQLESRDNNINCATVKLEPLDNRSVCTEFGYLVSSQNDNSNTARVKQENDFDNRSICTEVMDSSVNYCMDVEEAPVDAFAKSSELSQKTIKTEVTDVTYNRKASDHRSVCTEAIDINASNEKIDKVVKNSLINSFNAEPSNKNCSSNRAMQSMVLPPRVFQTQVTDGTQVLSPVTLILNDREFPISSGNCSDIGVTVKEEPAEVISSSIELIDRTLSETTSLDLLETQPVESTSSLSCDIVKEESRTGNDALCNDASGIKTRYRQFRRPVANNSKKGNNKADVAEVEEKFMTVDLDNHIQELQKLITYGRLLRIKNIGNMNNKTKGDACSILAMYTENVEASHNQECSICRESLMDESTYGGIPNNVVRYIQCKHAYHKECLMQLYTTSKYNGYTVCSECKRIYGTKLGVCPKGVMQIDVLNFSLPGHADTDSTICIMYYIKDGKQSKEHPNPGCRFTAVDFPRVAYLPYNDEGKKATLLLIVAWKRRLTFTIGTSTTSGITDTVTWNDIHHKTEPGATDGAFGYPDDDYFNRLTAELEAHGINDTSIGDLKKKDLS